MNRTRQHRGTVRIVAIVLGVVAAALPAAADDPPDLDRLLDLPPAARPDAAERGDGALGEAEELSRRLAGDAFEHAFSAAIRLMGLVSDRLERALDTGIETQRAQQDILMRLDALVDEARRRQSASSRSGGSSSSSSSSSSSPQGAGGARPGGQAGRPAPADGSPSGSDGDGDQEGPPPPPRQGDIATRLEESRSEWGNLPERIRSMLQQGRRESFSSLYEQMTREYYRRLAEE
ncbi:MAG: hypothetical protein KF817_05095 [Phycisphaeraceae bacterium]|nr:hypothetical protein [Phycisphaeraceae bacterium]